MDPMSELIKVSVLLFTVQGLVTAEIEMSSKILVIAASLCLGCFAIILWYRWDSDVPKPRLFAQGTLLFVAGVLGLPWIIVLNWTKQDRLVKRAFLVLQLLRLPVVATSKMQQVIDKQTISSTDQTWLAERSLAQVVNRYYNVKLIRDDDTLSVFPNVGWLSAYFLFNTTIARIGTSKFLDFSTSSIAGEVS